MGAAIGDALGARREGREMSRSEDIASLAERLGELIYTDDTHMTIGIAESLIESKGFHGEHMTQTFIKNYEAEPWRGYGPGPPRIFRMIKSGEAWDSAANKLYQGGFYTPIARKNYGRLPTNRAPSPIPTNWARKGQRSRLAL